MLDSKEHSTKVWSIRVPPSVHPGTWRPAVHPSPYSLLLLAVAIALVAPVRPAGADSFDRYRDMIDNYQQYNPGQRGEAIAELEKIQTKDVEKDYLLGMLNFLQGTDSMVALARSKPQQPPMEEIVGDPSVQKYYQAAERAYDRVEASHPGYQYIYCKYVELYRFSLNQKGLEKTTLALGKAENNDRTAECKDLLENTAEQFASRGKVQISRAIFHAAIQSWMPYPKYMLEAMGDIENVLDKRAQAKVWWQRCVAEADGKERQTRCQEKLQGRP